MPLPNTPRPSLPQQPPPFSPPFLTHHPFPPSPQVFQLNANNHHKTKSQILFSPIRRVADAKVLALAERFLGLLQSEIEKVSLFALSRIGELSDTVGSLRFGDTKVLSSEVQQFRNSSNDIMGGRSRMRNRSFSQSSNSSNSSNESDNNYEASTPSEITNAFPQARQKSASLPAVQTSSSNHSSYYQHHLQSNPPSSFYSGDDLNNTNQRPMFTDHFLGEESILVSAVDEVDAYVQVGIEVRNPVIPPHRTHYPANTSSSSLP